jgi:hypothetical protein
MGGNIVTLIIVRPTGGKLVISSGVVTSGLVLNLDAGNTASYPGSGTTWTDISGRGNNGTLTNGPTYSSSNGGSIVLDGADDYIVMSNLAPYLSNKTQFSFSMFVKITSSGSSLGTLFSYGNYVDYGNDIMFFYYPADLTLNFQIDNGADGGAGFAYTIGSWSNISVVYDGTQSSNAARLKVYLNGILQTLNFNTYTVPATTANVTASSSIGAYTSVGNTPNSVIGGNIPQVLVYNRALSSTEISQNFNALRGRYGI